MIFIDGAGHIEGGADLLQRIMGRGTVIGDIRCPARSGAFTLPGQGVELALGGGSIPQPVSGMPRVVPHCRRVVIWALGLLIGAGGAGAPVAQLRPGGRAGTLPRQLLLQAPRPWAR